MAQAPAAAYDAARDRSAVYVHPRDEVVVEVDDGRDVPLSEERVATALEASHSLGDHSFTAC